jgi:branched-chain amino acid aminotransferase
MSGPRHVWVDGRVLPADGTHLSVFDRGFQLGDGIFETLRVRGDRPTELAEHLARLRRSADGLGIPLPGGLDALIAGASIAPIAPSGPLALATVSSHSAAGSLRHVMPPPT